MLARCARERPFYAALARRRHTGQKHCAPFCAPLGRKPWQTVAERGGRESPLVARQSNTIANHRTQALKEPPQLLTEMLQVRVLPRGANPFNDLEMLTASRRAAVFSNDFSF